MTPAPTARTAGGFAPYQTHAGDKLLMADSGLRTSDQMFKEANDENRILTWFLRAFGADIARQMGAELVRRPT